jgi:hypothetical protein
VAANRHHPIDAVLSIETTRTTLSLDLQQQSMVSKKQRNHRKTQQNKTPFLVSKPRVALRSRRCHSFHTALRARTSALDT